MRPTSSTRSARRSASAAGDCPPPTPLTSARTCCRALVERSDIDPLAVEDVVFGCVDAIGPQAGNIARTCWLAAGLPEAIPGVTIDRQCGSSQQAVHFAAQAVMSGTSDLIVAGGVQNMSMIPIASAMTRRRSRSASPIPFSGSVGWRERYGDQEISQFRGAEMIAEKWDISREDMEQFALASHERALAAIDEGRFEREIVPYVNVAGEKITADEGPRRGTTLEKMAVAEDARRRRPAHRRRQQPDLRCRQRHADRLRRCGEAATGSRRGRASTTCRCAATARSSCSPRRSRPPRTRWRRPA